MSSSNFGNLRIPRGTPIGVGTEKANTIRSHWDTIDQVEAELRNKGLTDRPRPTCECPELNAEILTGPDSKQYTQTYLELQSWFTYVSECQAQVQSRILQFKNMQDIIGAQMRQQIRDAGTKKPSKEDMEDRMLLNPEYQEVTHELQKYKQSNVLLSTKVDSIERSLRLISRQVEIRRLDIEQNRNSNNMPTRGRYPQTMGDPRDPPTVGPGGMR